VDHRRLPPPEMCHLWMTLRALEEITGDCLRFWAGDAERRMVTMLTGPDDRE
jgi:hypothetical protein